jgi:hypothetical protein
MSTLQIVPLALGLAGFVAEGYAIACERRMQRFRLPGVSYWAATFRFDGGWQRTDLFAPEGLAVQKRAARFALWGVLLWTLAAVSWAVVFQLGR